MAFDPNEGGKTTRNIGQGRDPNTVDADGEASLHPALLLERARAGDRRALRLFKRIMAKRAAAAAAANGKKSESTEQTQPPGDAESSDEAKSVVVAESEASAKPAGGPDSKLPPEPGNPTRTREWTKKVAVADGKVDIDLGGSETIKDGERTTSHSSSVAYNDKGLRINAATGDAVETATDTVKTGANASYQEGHAKFAASRSAKHEHEDESKDGYSRDGEVDVSSNSAAVKGSLGSNEEHKDDDGAHSTKRQYAGGAKVERDERGHAHLETAELSASSTKKEGEHSNARSGSAKYDKKGFHVDLAETDAVETKTDKISTNRSGKYEDGHVVIGGKREASHDHEDGTKDGYNRDGEVNLSRTGAAVKGSFGSNEEHKDDDGAHSTKRQYGGGAKVERDKDGHVHFDSAELSASSNKKEGEHSNARLGSAKYDKKGFHADLSETDAVETKTDKISTVKSGKYEDGHVIIGGKREASHVHEDETKDGYHREGEINLSRKSAEVKGGLGNSEEHQDYDGAHATKRDYSGGLKVERDKDGVATPSGQVSGTEVKKEGDRTRTTAASGGWSKKDGLVISASGDDVIDTKYDNIKTTKSATFKNGRASASSTRAVTHKHDDGSSDTYAKDRQLGVSEHGVDLGLNHSSQQTTKGEDGTEIKGDKTSSGVNFGVDLEKKEGSVKLSKKVEDADGKLKSGVDATASVGKDHASAEVGVSRGKSHLSVLAGVTAKASDPYKVGAQWLVDWMATLSGGAAAAHGENKLGASASTELSGTKVFKSQTEAREFATDAATEILQMHGTPKTVDSALGMKPGEKIGESTSVGGSAGGSASFEGATVGVGVSGERKRAVGLTRIDAARFVAELSQSDMAGASFTEGGMGIKAGASTSKTNSGKVRLGFNVTTPEGKAALQAFLGEPRTITKGAELVSETHDEKGERGTTLGGFGAETSSTGITHNTVEKSEDGESHIHTGERVNTASHKRLGEYKSSEKLTAEHQVDKNNLVTDSYQLEAHVKTASGQIANQDLAAATGTTWQPLAKSEKSSGNWDVSAQLTPQQARECALNLLKHPDLSALGVNYEDGRELIAQIRASKGEDDLMRALADFVAKTGAKGFAVIRENISALRTTSRQGAASHLDIDITLEGDTNFLGHAGHAKLQAEIEEWQAGIKNPNSPSAAAIGSKAQLELSTLRHKMAAIADRSRYHDLPTPLRQQELETMSGYAGTMQSIVDSTTQAPGAAQASAATTQPSDGVHRFMAVQKAGCHDAERQVNKSRWVHAGNCTDGYVARLRLTDRTSVQRYADADSHYEQGSKALRMATAHEERADKLQVQLAEQPAGGASQKSQLQALYSRELQQAGGQYSFARVMFEKAEALMQAIRISHPEEEARMFVGYSRPFDGG